ncbi:hypothetical protein [Allocoleopsis sp.]|uniref:hypothetical protein n=1 Tax=Allocoleopsis sp. TaxID=3088169 RepID=UPI002FCF8561
MIIFPQTVTQTWTVGWGVSQVFGTFSLVQVQGFCQILPDFRETQQPSLPLKVLMAKGFRLVQQALSRRTELNNIINNGLMGCAHALPILQIIKSLYLRFTDYADL